MNRVLIVVGDAAETVDTLYPYFRLQEDGFTPVVAAPERRRYQMVLHEVKPGWTITKEWEGYSIDADVAFHEIDPREYLGIFFSGGRAPEYLREDEDLLAITRHFFATEKPSFVTKRDSFGEMLANPSDSENYAPRTPVGSEMHGGTQEGSA